jgi:predicted nucleic acid-binding protein
MDSFVVDASVAVAWLHSPQLASVAESALEALERGASLHAPALWPLEVANSLLVLARRGRIKDSERIDALNRIKMFAVKIDFESASMAFTTLSALAAKFQISIYDAAYLELAMRRNLPLACKDGGLAGAAKKAGVAVWT